MDGCERAGVERMQIDAPNLRPEHGVRGPHVQSAHVKASVGAGIGAGIGAGYFVVLALTIVR